VRLFRRAVSKGVAGYLSQLHDQQLHPTSHLPNQSNKLYQLAEQKLAKLTPLFLEPITRLGQMQLIRRQVANELNFSAKLDSKILSSALEAMNLALTNDVKAHYSNPDNKPYPGNPVLPDIADYLETTGQLRASLAHSSCFFLPSCFLAFLLSRCLASFFFASVRFSIC
jgi:WASH complex subunit strumpellin